MRDLARESLRKLPWIQRRDAKIQMQQQTIARYRSQAQDLRLALEAERGSSSQRLRSVKEIERDLADAEMLSERRRRLAQRLKMQLGRHSFAVNLELRKREVQVARDLKGQPYSPMLQVPRKLFTQSLASSHGVLAPEVFNVWDSIDQIDLAGLPPEFVLKADGGTSSLAVFPLRRQGDDNFKLVNSKKNYTSEGLRSHLRQLGGQARGPFFAEELLQQGGSLDIPDDIKVFCAYGTVMWTLLRRVGTHGDIETATVRHVDADGTDLGAIAKNREHDHDIPLPDLYHEIIKSAQHLSRAVGLDFCRVDMYSTTKGPVFGEITVAPGGHQEYIDAADEMAGMKWVEGGQRLAFDIAKGRPQGILFGGQPHQWHYQPSTNRLHPGSWAREHVSCDQWCRQPSSLSDRMA